MACSAAWLGVRLTSLVVFLQKKTNGNVCQIYTYVHFSINLLRPAFSMIAVWVEPEDCLFWLPFKNAYIFIYFDTRVLWKFLFEEKYTCVYFPGINYWILSIWQLRICFLIYSTFVQVFFKLYYINFIRTVFSKLVVLK